MSEYSIATFLETLSDDELEKEIVELVVKGYVGEDLLQRILKIIGKKK